MPYRRLIAATAFVTFATLAGNGSASGPLAGRLAAELRKDSALSADSGWARTDTHLAVADNLSAPLAPGLFAHTHLAFEPGHDPGREQAPALKEVYLQYAADGIAIRGGKLGRKLGISWNAAPVPWSTGFIENYEANGQIGTAADISFNAGSTGRHVLTAGRFFAGTDVLSRSVFADDAQPAESNFSSHALALSGDGGTAAPGLSYHLAYISRDAAPQGRPHETGFTAAFSYVLQPIGVQVAPIVEWVSRTERNTKAVTDTASLTAGIGFTWEGWTLAVSRATRETHAANDPEIRDSSRQMSLSYGPEGGFGINAGYSHSETSGLATEAYGLVIDYAFTF